MTAPSFRAVDQQTGVVAEAPSGTIAATIHEIDELRTQLATAEDDLHDMRESRNAWADRAETAERALTKFQDQAVRIQELKAELGHVPRWGIGGGAVSDILDFGPEISVIVHDPVPDSIAPITADEMKGSLEALGYHVQGVLVRNDFPPPCWLVNRLQGKHFGPFSTHLDAATALEFAELRTDTGRLLAWSVVGDDEFNAYLDAKAVSR